MLFGGQGEVFQNGKFERQTENGRLKAIFTRQLFDDFSEFDCSTQTWQTMARTSVFVF